MAVELTGGRRSGQECSGAEDKASGRAEIWLTEEPRHVIPSGTSMMNEQWADVAVAEVAGCVLIYHPTNHQAHHRNLAQMLSRGPIVNQCGRSDYHRRGSTRSMQT